MSSIITAADVEAASRLNIDVSEETKNRTVEMMKPQLLGILTPDEYQAFKAYRVKYLEQLLSMDSLKDCSDLHEAVTDLVDHSIQFDGESGTMLFMSLFKHYCPNPTEKQMELAYFYVWAQSVMITLYYPLDDLVDRTYIRRYKPTYFHLVGSEKATMMILLLFFANNEALTLKFESEPYGMKLQRRFGYYLTYGTAGMTLEAFEAQKQEKIWDVEFRDVRDKRKGSPVHDLPLEVAAMMTGHVLDETSLDYWRSLMFGVNKLLCSTNDYNDTYPEAPTGKRLYVDIVNGVTNWCSTTAWTLANKEQQNVLKENYGFEDKEKIAKVLQVYQDLKLKDHFSRMRKQLIQEILVQAERCPEELAPKNVLVELFQSVMEEHGLAWG